MNLRIIIICGLLLPLLWNGGCRTHQADTAKPRLSLDETVRRTDDNLLALRIEDERRQLVREYEKNALLLDIPSRIAQWQISSRALPESAGAESRAALERSLLYFRALLAASGSDAKRRVEARLRQKLELEAAEYAAKYDSLLRCKAILTPLAESSAFPDSLRRELDEIEAELTSLRMELRILTGLPPGSEFDWEPIHRKLPLPLPEELGAVALFRRPELESAGIPEEAVRHLESMLPPRAPHPEIGVMHRAEQLLRFPAQLDLRNLYERKTPPEVALLLQALAIRDEVMLDYRIVTRAREAFDKASHDAQALPDDAEAKLTLERAALRLYLAELRLWVDLGFYVGEAMPERIPAPAADAKWNEAAALAAQILEQINNM